MQNVWFVRVERIPLKDSNFKISKSDPELNFYEGDF